MRGPTYVEFPFGIYRFYVVRCWLVIDFLQRLPQKKRHLD